MQNFKEVGEAFANYYYNLFDSDRSKLNTVYRPTSMLSFEGDQYQGTEAITNKLTGLPFQTVKHQIITIDCQPTTSVNPSGVIVSVSGNLVIDDNQNPMKFAQCFHLLPDAGNASQFWVHNDIFRLNLG